VYILIIIIDGYNLLKQIFPKVKGKLDKQRKQFIELLGFYKKKKTKEIKEIIVVFDGGFFRHAEREIKLGVVVVFSGQKSSADEWILNYVQNNKEKQILLVSMDRELISKSNRFKVDNIKVFDFYKIIQNTVLVDELSGFYDKNMQDFLYKFEDKLDGFQDVQDGFEHKDNKALDLLMKQYSFGIETVSKDDSYKELNSRKSKGQKLSKKEKTIYKKIKKL
jgi:hypothetical protein